MWLQLSPVGCLGNGPHDDHEGDLFEELEVIEDIEDDSSHASFNRERRKYEVLEITALLFRDRGVQMSNSDM